MLTSKSNSTAIAFYVASLVSVAASIGVWVTVDGDPGHAERFGIFVGLWLRRLWVLLTSIGSKRDSESTRVLGYGRHC